ncbi:MAG: beta-N-acetylhexosaminidase [Nitrosomonadales bacterium]|nr:beta-N-acetylhexosaminidase [Nitrosomonadales bacterium]
MTCLMIDIQELVLNNSDIKRIEHPLVGGIILFTRNYKNKQQLKNLIKSIRKIKKNLLIAVDHEGGRVQRFRDEFTEIPDMKQIGKIYQKDSDHAKLIARLVGWVISEELAEMDIDFSFTPVLDIDYDSSSIIGNRSFHKDADIVSELAIALIEGLNFGGMQSVGKHFPGHGFIKADTHIEKATDDRPLKIIQNNDIKTFKNLINAGLKGIMPSHIIYSLCDQNPSGLSNFWLQDQLRDRLNFKGAIFSDDITMKAIESFQENITKRVQNALEAGCDMVLVCNSPNKLDKLIEELKWNSKPNSLKRLEIMKLNKKKRQENKLKFHNFNIKEARSIITKL